MYSTKSVIATAALLALCLSSCGDDSVTSPTVKNDIPLSSTLLGQTTYSVDQIIGHYNRPNLAGLIGVETVERSIYFTQSPSGTQSIDGVANYSQATFRNGTGSGISAGNIDVNNGYLKEVSTGVYDQEGPAPLDLYFGTGYNRIQVEGTNTFPGFADSVNFTSAVKMSGITRGQSIDRNKSLTLNWTGSTQDVAEIRIMRDNPGTNPAERAGTSFFVDDNGSFVIPAAVFQGLNAGMAHLEIRRIEPKFISVGGGKEVCVLGISRHVVSVNLTN